MEDLIKELRISHREQQGKFIYYITSLCVTSIGFAIYQTINLPLKCSQIPLGIAVFCWSVSIICGLRFIQYGMNIIHANVKYLKVQSGSDPDVGNHPMDVMKGLAIRRESLDKNIADAAWYFNTQYYLFFAGMVSFIFWHIFEMYLRR